MRRALQRRKPSGRRQSVYARRGRRPPCSGRAAALAASAAPRPARTLPAHRPPASDCIPHPGDPRAQAAAKTILPTSGEGMPAATRRRQPHIHRHAGDAHVMQACGATPAPRLRAPGSASPQHSPRTPSPRRTQAGQNMCTGQKYFPRRVIAVWRACSNGPAVPESAARL